MRVLEWLQRQKVRQQLKCFIDDFCGRTVLDTTIAVTLTSIHSQLITAFIAIKLEP